MNEFLIKPLSTLARVGDTLSVYLEKLINGNKVFDLLLHKPSRVEKISILPKISEISHNELVIITGKIQAHFPPANSRQPFKITCYNQGGFFNLVFFKIFPSQLQKLKIGNEIAVLGNFTKILTDNQIVHPQEIHSINEIEKMPKFNVIYPLSSTISHKFLTYKITEILKKITDDFEEWIDIPTKEKLSFPNFVNALKNLHSPKNFEDLLPQNISRRRLAYDELLAWQLAMRLVKNSNNNLKQKKIISKNQFDFTKSFLDSLPFELTKSQLKAINEINSEISSSKKMLRLLQGDVGSGKTIVAIFACLENLNYNKQACVIAPTTVLAKQHFHYFKKLLLDFKINVELLTSANTKKQKNEINNKLREGQIDILISTHAVLEDEVKFKNLGLAIIDEQHRFGVLQRLKLVEKNDDVDLLLMSATPIPRSLMMGLYGDMDISILNEKPKNRLEITTSIMSNKKSSELYQSMLKVIDRGEKIYWICPAIEENEEINLISVESKFNELQKNFGEKKVAIIHGKMKESQKEKVMQDFANPNGDCKILVATTVIEVGVDVAQATVIIIENSENFGLAQLHQLRGRVGRSEKKSFCILLYGEKFGAKQKQRLSILRESNDGFFIAEEDLKLRGSGELIGTRQSGFPEFRIADLNFDNDLLKISHQQVSVILNNDSLLLTENNNKYRYLMKLFGYSEFLSLVKSG
jgi:ATP-dependent DNA helicase RecG